VGFSAPGLLPFAALAAIPVIIHLLSRLRLKRAEFPSLLLLTTAKKERFSWLRLRELLLLIFRTLALLGLLLALARPYLRARLPGLGLGSDVVVVIDDSYSMSEQSRWPRALAAARGLLGSTGAGRRVALATATDRLPSAGLQWQTARRALPVLDSLKPSSSGATLGPAMERAVALARPQGAAVFVITDLQARAIPDSWQPPRDVAVTLVDVGDKNTANAGVRRIYTEDRFPVAGRATRLKADLTNWSNTGTTRTVALTVGSRREEKAVSLRPRETAVVGFDASLSDSGFHSARVELSPDSVSADDVRWLVVRQPRRTPVLVVESQSGAAAFVARALGTDSASVFDLAVVPPSALGSRDIRRYAAVVITDAAVLGRADWTRLDFYLRSGGSALLMFSGQPGDSALLGGLIRASGLSVSSGFLSVSSVDTLHPVLEILKTTNFAGARFLSHVRLGAADSRTLARLTDDDPLILEIPHHRLILWAFAPDPVCTDLVYKAAFVPLLHRTLLYLSGASDRNEHAVNDTLRVPVADAGPVGVSAPWGRTTVTPAPGAGRPEAVLTRTGLPGIYTIGTRPVAVNVPAEEGDLTRASAGELVRRGYQVSKGTVDTTSDLSGAALWAAAVAFAVEMLLLAL
jgi:hypothetical protein